MIFQKLIPYDTTYPKLPGTRPISPDEWIICDDAFSQQMALRDKLIDTKKDKVLAISEEAREAAVELSKITLDFCTSKLGYQKKNNKIMSGSFRDAFVIMLGEVVDYSRIIST